METYSSILACIFVYTVEQFFFVGILFSKIDVRTKFKFTKFFHCIKNLFYRKVVAI